MENNTVPEPQEELVNLYLKKLDEKFPSLPELHGEELDAFKNFLNKCKQIFGLQEWGNRPRQAKLFDKLALLWAVWGKEHLKSDTDEFKAGAAWMREQLLKNAVDGKIVPCNFEETEFCLDETNEVEYITDMVKKNNLKIGDTVKQIFIKEE